MAWQGKVALVTGASSGIGAVTAKRLAREGLRVALVARREERLQDLAAQIQATGQEALVLVADLADEMERTRIVEQVYAVYGAVDVLVNNAGLTWYHFFAEMPWSLAQQMIQVNVAALVHLTLLILPEMQERDQGHIINVGSIAGKLPMQGTVLYAATKSFVETFTTALYREVQGTNVRVSVVKPGPVQTELYETAFQQSGVRVPGERFAVAPERVAEQVWRLLNRPRRFAYVPGWFLFIPLLEFAFGWLFDRLGPVLLWHQLRGTRSVQNPRVE